MACLQHACLSTPVLLHRSPLRDGSGTTTLLNTLASLAGDANAWLLLQPVALPRAIVEEPLPYRKLAVRLQEAYAKAYVRHPMLLPDVTPSSCRIALPDRAALQ